MTWENLIHFCGPPCNRHISTYVYQIYLCYSRQHSNDWCHRFYLMYSESPVIFMMERRPLFLLLCRCQHMERVWNMIYHSGFAKMSNVACASDILKMSKTNAIFDIFCKNLNGISYEIYNFFCKNLNIV